MKWIRKIENIYRMRLNLKILTLPWEVNYMIRIDAKGKTCPIPVIEARNALKAVEEDETILVIVDNEMAKKNLEKMAKGMGYEWDSKTINEYHYEVKIIKGLGSDKSVKELENEKKENTLVAISSDKMGEGNDELGQVLIKGFIYALAESEQIPSTIVFYNGGVKLSTKQSSVLDSLQKLERLGVEILSCGTCLNYYNLEDELSVGQITNMYNIVEKMNAANKIIKP